MCPSAVYCLLTYPGDLFRCFLIVDPPRHASLRPDPHSAPNPTPRHTRCCRTRDQLFSDTGKDIECAQPIFHHRTEHHAGSRSCRAARLLSDVWRDTACDRPVMLFVLNSSAVLNACIISSRRWRERSVAPHTVCNYRIFTRDAVVSIRLASPHADTCCDDDGILHLTGRVQFGYIYGVAMVGCLG